MSLKKIIIIICILAAVAIFFIIPRIIFSGAEFVEEFAEDENIESNEIEEENTVISGEGTLTSFNIEKIDTSYWKNVDEVLFNDEELVKANQLLLKTSNKESKGEISATIDGRIYIQEQSGKDMYYIYDLDNIGIEFKVSEEESVNLQIGQKAKITFIGGTESYEGVVYYIQKIPVNEEVSVKVKLEYNDNLKFGTNAKVEILQDEPIIENTEEFDIKNTTTKIGKTKIILKDSGNASVQAFDMDALMEEYMSQMMEGLDFEGEDIPDFDGLGGEQYEGEIPLEFDTENQIDVEGLSKELSEQWNNYWKLEYEKQYEEKKKQLENQYETKIEQLQNRINELEAYCSEYKSTDDVEEPNTDSKTDEEPEESDDETDNDKNNQGEGEE